MTTYRFTCHYQSSAGTWQAGDVAEFDDDTAAWLMRDVAGCIEPVVEPEQDTVRQETKPQHDRQLKRAPRSR